MLKHPVMCLSHRREFYFVAQKLLKKLHKKTYKPLRPTVPLRVATKGQASFALVSQAARETPYSGEYLSLLVRKGKIAGRKFGRNWYVAKKDLEKYLRERQVQQMQSYRPVVSLASIPISPLSSPFIPLMGQTEKPKQDLSTDIKKELDELEE
ncbi:MAG: helix-turn-helix domain-containing protein, partial [Patescibacteria group bacterium]